jgi:hypothetical protein
LNKYATGFINYIKKQDDLTLTTHTAAMMGLLAVARDADRSPQKYHIPDFSNWKNHAAFEAAFARLEKDLRTHLHFTSAR